MKKFLKLCNCKRATDAVDSANFRSSQQNDADLSRKIDEQIDQIEQEIHDREIAQFLQEQTEIEAEFEHYTEIEDLKIANKLHRRINNLYYTRHNELLEQEMKDAKLAMETQDFEYANMLSELQTLHPNCIACKIEYINRHKLFLKKCGKEIIIQKIPTPTKTEEPESGNPDGAATGQWYAGTMSDLEVFHIKNQEYFLNRNKRSLTKCQKCTKTTDTLSPWNRIPLLSGQRQKCRLPKTADCPENAEGPTIWRHCVEIAAPTKTQESEIVVPEGPIKEEYVASNDSSRPKNSSKESSETMLGTYELMEVLMILKILKF